MNARQRFVTAVWLLVGSVAVGWVGVLAWSHFDSHHGAFAVAGVVLLRVNPKRQLGTDLAG